MEETWKQEGWGKGYKCHFTQASRVLGLDFGHGSEREREEETDRPDKGPLLNTQAVSRGPFQIYSITQSDAKPQTSPRKYKWEFKQGKSSRGRWFYDPSPRGEVQLEHRVADRSYTTLNYRTENENYTMGNNTLHSSA